MDQQKPDNSGWKTIDLQGHDIMAVLKDMGIPYDMDNASLVTVESMSPEIRKLAERLVEPKACFDNAAILLSVLRRKDMKYVIGYASAPIPFEHAWVKVGELYYDPTWEISVQEFGAEYLSLVEMDWEELCKTMNDMNTEEPPDLNALHRLRRQAY